MHVLGLMSGTSLDGLDMAVCTFSKIAKGFEFEILAAETINYSNDWKLKLNSASKLSAEKYFELHAAYGNYLAKTTNIFLESNKIQVDLIASHGHTIFHQPELGFSTQLGCGATIAALTGVNTVCDFRSLDVALGGQGAPLVPIGDKLLFGDYHACLNIGGIANISYTDEKGKRVAYDICEANMLLNYLSEKLGQTFDKGGLMARSGSVDKDLENKLNGLDYYTLNGAKSIGREWFEQNVLEIIRPYKGKEIDLLASATEHVATIISTELNRLKIKSVLVTGGGALNTYLIERIKSQTNGDIILPRTEIINFKEALIFAFLGYLRVEHQVNTLQSVSGASRDSIGGALYLGFTK